MKKMLAFVLLIVVFMSTAAYAQVTAIEIRGAGNDKFTGAVTGYEYSYGVSDVIVRIFANETGSSRKIQATITFQSTENYTPNVDILHNALENPNKNFMVELNSPNNTVFNNTKIMSVVVVGKLRPAGTITIKPQ
ncbi:MAG TPA: hypothetical protein VIS94_14340 [Desulfomonilia bacterium]